MSKKKKIKNLKIEQQRSKMKYKGVTHPTFLSESAFSEKPTVSSINRKFTNLLVKVINIKFTFFYTSIGKVDN